MTSAQDAARARGGATLAAVGVGVDIDDTRIVGDVSLTVPPTGITALIGPNGSGKSTLLRALAGLERPQHGTVTLDGVDLFSMPRRARALRIAVVEQESSTELSLTVREVAMLGRLPHQGLLGGATHHDEQLVDEQLAVAGVADLADRDHASLSGGERQRVRLAAALVQQPSVLVLDEPTNHLDVRAALETMRLLRPLAASGITVLAALHDLTLAGLADTVALLSAGSLVAAGPTADVLTAEAIGAVYGVRAHVAPHPLSGMLAVQVDLP